MRILLVRLSALGDVVSGLHVLSTILARDGSARVGWLVEDRCASILEGHPQIDRLHVFERPRLGRPQRWHRLVRLARDLRRERYDLVFDLQGNLKSGFLAWVSGAPRRMGLARPFCREGNHLFIRERIPAPLPHKVKRYWAVVDAALGEGPHPYGTLEAEPRDHGGFVLHPGISRFRLNKRWPAARFAGLADRLVERFGLPILLTAGPGEREQAEEVARRMRAGCEIVEPADLGELKSILAGARLVVSADTGPAHVAAALGVATLTLVGPTDPREIAPYGPRSEFLTSGARCSPCSLRSCPDPVCMTEMDEERVFGRVLELLEESA